MPELPEVETIRKELVKQIIGKYISDIHILLDRSFVNHTQYDISELIGNITQIDRYGKYLVMQVNQSFQILIHLRMTGKLIYCPFQQQNSFKTNHIRLIFNFQTGDCLLFDDVRTFGKVEIFSSDLDIKSYKNIGIDALDEDFNFNKLKAICMNKKTQIKVLLLNQNLIAGIGNIYAQEILFDAKVSPLIQVNQLTDKELKRIVVSTKKILSLAVKYNGTSISDFRRVDDKTGEFQDFLQVYGKITCPVCKSDILKIRQGGRSTNYCPKCQI
ncbi:MAG: DNA-formamidopyrimidine glycosylase [Candidatus Cloacimonetes bacterium]|nr:DNA-formamidopyrimidine glycosylase [Candidatus Cloacimonadota bacterium]MDD4155148.1 DNA-formamidopyrimidine glycosylase [Candidatus Cloacimonadota bacterium]